MRALFLATGLALSAGCFDFDLDLDLELDFSDACFLGGPCVTASNPFLFLDETPTRVALGGEARIAYLVHDTVPRFELVSQDPAVLAIENRPGGQLAMRAVGEGSTVISARAPDGAELGTRVITVAKVASVGFMFAPAGDQPRATLAALPGARELIRVLPRDAKGLDLGGADKVVQLRFDGDLAAIDPTTAQARPGEFRVFGSPIRKPGYDIGVGFGAVGAASITASIDGIELGSIAIDVVAAARDVSLRVTNPPVVNTFLVVSLIGDDANGVPLAGLVGDFTATPPDLVTIFTPSQRGEVLVLTKAPGTVTIDAALSDRVVSTTITIE
jgi:hypothetical protein